MSKNVTKLWEREFNIVKDGLSEAEVVAFVSELISERDSLVQRQKHLSSLVKLAERTIAEADNIAKQVKEEAAEQTKAEASRIIAETEARAQQIMDEKQAEVTAMATEQAQAIKAKAELEAELLLDRQRERIQPEISNFVHQLYSQLLSELESLKQQVGAFEVEFEHQLSQPAEGTSTVTKEEDERHDEFMELIRTVDQTNTGEPEWELEILPPIDIMKMTGIVTYLDSLSEVEKTEIIPRTDRPSIIVFLREPIYLIDVLRTLPEVAQVKEDATDTNGADGKLKKVQIVLSKKSVIDETKEKLNSEVVDILSSDPPLLS